MNDKPWLERIETVSFPEQGIFGLLAKIDTGADYGALHATNIIETEQGIACIIMDGQGNPISCIFPTYVRHRVKSSNGMSEKRFFVDMNVIIKGIQIPVHISLRDRSAMEYPMLLGWNNIKNHFHISTGIPTKEND